MKAKQSLALILAACMWPGLMVTAAGAGLKVDEPSFQIALSPQTAGNTTFCPAGFYVLSISDGAQAGVAPGSYSSEVLLLDPGTRVLEGGLNFGGLAAAEAPAFASVNIANATNENQELRISIRGSRPSSQEPVRARVVLQRRLPEPVTVVFDEVVTLGLDAAYQRTAVVPPAFYDIAVTPLDPIPGADAFLLIALESSFVGRPGGGFQGGVNIGGIHDPAANSVSGFASFCLGSAHTVRVRTIGRTTNPAFGAGDLRLRLSRDDGNVPANLVYDSDAQAPPSTVQATLRIDNAMSTILYAPRFNNVNFANVGPNQTIDLSYQGPSTGRLEFGVAMNRFGQSVRIVRTDDIVFTANGQTQIARVAHNNVSVEVASGNEKLLQPLALYSPTVEQNSPSPIEARYFNGLTGTEEAIPMPSQIGPINVTNSTLPGMPRVYFPIQSAQNARVRAVQSGTGIVATIYQQSFADLLASPNGISIAPVTAQTFGTVSLCTPPTFEVPSCVGSSSVFQQTAAVLDGNLHFVRFSLCPNYNQSLPNNLQISRPINTCGSPPGPCPNTTSGLSSTIFRSNGSIVSGPISVANGQTLNLTIAGSQWQAGETYCVLLQPAAPFNGGAQYLFGVGGTNLLGLE